MQWVEHEDGSFTRIKVNPCFSVPALLCSFVTSQRSSMFWWAGELPKKVVHFAQISTCCFMAPCRPKGGPGPVYWPRIITSLLQNLSMTFVTPESYVPWIVALKPEKSTHILETKEKEVPRRTITAFWTCVVRAWRVVLQVERGKVAGWKKAFYTLLLVCTHAD